MWSRNWKKCKQHGKQSALATKNNCKALMNNSPMPTKILLKWVYLIMCFLCCNWFFFWFFDYFKVAEIRTQHAEYIAQLTERHNEALKQWIIFVFFIFSIFLKIFIFFKKKGWWKSKNQYWRSRSKSCWTSHRCFFKTSFNCFVW